jgi:hypothetical protein
MQKKLIAFSHLSPLFGGFLTQVLNTHFFFFCPFPICYAFSTSSACCILSPSLWHRLFASLRNFSVWSRGCSGDFFLFALIHSWGSKGNFLQVCWKSFVWKNNKWRQERDEEEREANRRLRAWANLNVLLITGLNCTSLIYTSVPTFPQRLQRYPIPHPLLYRHTGS